MTGASGVGTSRRKVLLQFWQAGLPIYNQTGESSMTWDSLEVWSYMSEKGVQKGPNIPEGLR